MEAVLQVDLQTAGYEGKSSVVHDVRFTVHSGQLMALIGPNGAGKSTTIKSILGLLKNVTGTVSMSGPRGTYAYVPEQPILYEDLTLWEHIEFAAAAHNLERQSAMERAELLLDRFRLSGVRHELPGSFSKGMQQKLMLIVGFLLQPDVYIVDEPFVGLDPRATKDLLSLLEEERARGAGVLLSTHVLDTAEKIADSFVLLSGGEMVASGTLAEVRETAELPDGSLFDCFDVLT